MITDEQIMGNLAERRKYFEKLADEKLQFEAEGGIKIKSLLDLTYHIADPKLMPDHTFFIRISKKEFSRWIESIIDDKKLIRNIANAESKIEKRIGFERGLTEDQMKHLLGHVQRQKILSRGREEITRLIKKRTKPTEQNRKALIKKLEKEEKKKLIAFSEQIYQHTIKGERVEEKLIESMKKKYEIIKEIKELESQNYQIMQNKPKGKRELKKVESLTKQTLKRREKLEVLSKKIEELESSLFTYKDKVSEMLEREFGTKKVIKEITTPRESDVYKKRTSEEIKEMIKQGKKAEERAKKKIEKGERELIKR
ncbi:hypothetical protein ACFLZ7_01810 [Nanoarchaeota archaeon]